ncbi:DUF515 domain-containing protein [Methanobacterium alcaliphilum]|uniref:DUF515 domain-containing protein n=1 Tax=Methanobacterium alcaliphilum TaxID=392018 RepID=UPI00200B040E|nr:DUF515 domain-containing protein [Methanobacterium alcaliphilum]MCK9150390.1 DUF515 domain-containing protein [Methanobacterium alcaliphilum]
MLDKLKGSKKKDKDTPPDLRKGDEKESSDVGGKIKDLVGKMSGNKGDKKGLSASPGDSKKEPKKMPRPMPKPRIKPKTVDKAKLKPRTSAPPKKPGSGIGGGFGRRVPDDDQKTLIGAAVFGIILIILVASGYYFLVYAPYQEDLQSAKDQKITEVNAYYKGSLAVDSERQTLLDEINNGVTREEVLAIDVIGPATKAWRVYQNQQINTKKDRFGRVMVVYSTDTQSSTDTSDQSTISQKNVILKVSEAQKFVNQSDATVLANMEIQTPDTVAVPIMISRLQAAGGLISVGNSVDVYLKQAPAESTGNNTTEQQPTTTSQSNTPDISGATVLAILRAKDSGTIDANLINSQKYTLDSLTSQSERAQTSSTDVEQLLRAAASGGFNEAETTALLQNYGIKLSDYERASNLGELDAQYLVLLEVPRENVLFLIQNMDSVMLTVPTQQAPTWMIQELRKIYG